MKDMQVHSQSQDNGFAQIYQKTMTPLEASQKGHVSGRLKDVNIQ